MDDPYGENARRNRVRRILSRWISEFVCVSKVMESWLKDTVGVRRRVTQIYNGVDAELYRRSGTPGEFRRNRRLDAHSFVVVICGRLDPIKDHATLFRSFEALRQRFPDSHLLVVGEGPQRAALEELAGKNVQFLGNRDNIPEILENADVFALTSLNEGISNTILEAMAAELPVVATDVGGNPELVRPGETGYLFPPGDADALLKALKEYRESPELRRRHGRQGRRAVLEEFSVKRMVSRYEEVWQRLRGEESESAG
jgi:glycosyltransferase involved in cell wall biosynthesis